MTSVKKEWLIFWLTVYRDVRQNFETIFVGIAVILIFGIVFYNMATDAPKQTRANILVQGRVAGWLSTNQISYERLVDCYGSREGIHEGNGNGTCNVIIRSIKPMAQVTCDSQGCYRRQ